MLSYTKAVLDYKLSTQQEKKILENKLRLTKIKVYYPSSAMLEWRESISENPGENTKALEKLHEFTKALEKELGVVINGREDNGKCKLVTKTMNNRYKLAGDYCIRLYYENKDDNDISKDVIHFPADPEVILKWDVKDFLSKYKEIFNAYSVSKLYLKKLHSRKTILRDEL